MSGVLLLGSVWGGAFVAFVLLILWGEHRRDRADEARRRARMREALWEQEQRESRLFGPFASEAREIRSLPTAVGFPEWGSR